MFYQSIRFFSFFSVILFSSMSFAMNSENSEDDDYEPILQEEFTQFCSSCDKLCQTYKKNYFESKDDRVRKHVEILTGSFELVENLKLKLQELIVECELEHRCEQNLVRFEDVLNAHKRFKKIDQDYSPDDNLELFVSSISDVYKTSLMWLADAIFYQKFAEYMNPSTEHNDIFYDYMRFLILPRLFFEDIYSRSMQDALQQVVLNGNTMDDFERRRNMFKLLEQMGGHDPNQFSTQKLQQADLTYFYLSSHDDVKHVISEMSRSDYSSSFGFAASCRLMSQKTKQKMRYVIRKKFFQVCLNYLEELEIKEPNDFFDDVVQAIGKIGKDFGELVLKEALRKGSKMLVDKVFKAAFKQ